MAEWCNLCPLGQQVPRQLLDGVGPIDAEIMLVGEAPGKTEERTGVPFVGESGRLLDSMLQAVGLKREDVRITNAVRCRPPDARGENRKPTSKEITACRKHLIREVGEVQPKVIIALGNEALKSLTGATGISAFRGQGQALLPAFQSAVERLPQTVMPTYHPAFALREPQHENEIIQDLRTALAGMRGGFRKIETPWTFSTQGTPLDYDEPVWAWDIETNARDLNDPELEVRFLAIDDGKNIVIFNGPQVPLAVECMNAFIRPDHWLVGHNASAFDRAVILEKYGVNLKTHDTQLLAHRIDEEQPLKLQDLAVKYLGVAPWKDGFDVHFWRRGPQSPEEWESAYTYNARDTRYTRLLFLELWALADDGEKRLYRDHNLPCSRALATTERRGVYISTDNAHRAIAELDLDQRAALLMLKSHTDPDFNPGSHQQVRELLFSDLLLPVQKRSKKTHDASTDEEALQKLALKGYEPEIVKTVLEFRENTKLLQFARDFIERATKGYTDRNNIFHANLCSPYIFPRYSMTSTVNDRTSCFTPNLQQTPREKRVRSCIAAPPGYVLCEADYSQLELRQAAELAGPASALWQEYQNPQADVHMTMAEWLTGKDRSKITDDERSRAKPPNFGYLYFSEWRTYQRIALTDYGLNVSEKEARYAQDAFRNWGMQPWWDRIEDELAKNGCVTSIFGSKRRLPAFSSKGSNDQAFRDPMRLHSGRKLYYYTQLEALRMAINFSDASPSSHLTLLAHALLVGNGFHTTGYIHDAVHMLLPCDPGHIEAAKKRIKEIMEVETPQMIEQIFGYKYTVPLIADVKIGRWWGDKGK